MSTVHIRTKKSQVVEYNIIQTLLSRHQRFDTDTANFNQVLSKHLDDIVSYNLTFFGANMNFEHEKRKKLPGLLKKQYFF
jgi:alpha-galactosidase